MVGAKETHRNFEAPYGKKCTVFIVKIIAEAGNCFTIKPLRFLKGVGRSVWLTRFRWVLPVLYLWKSSNISVTKLTEPFIIISRWMLLSVSGVTVPSSCSLLTMYQRSPTKHGSLYVLCMVFHFRKYPGVAQISSTGQLKVKGAPVHL